MWIFRVDEPRLGVIRIREWRRRARHTIGLLVLLPACATAGLFILAQSNTSFPNKILTSLWNGLNFVTTLGAFGVLVAHTLNASLANAVPGESPLRKMLFESAGHRTW
ncbi:hypothetical protein [Paraburkholderia sp. HD33-4]|uniref:hypothetical protein n=1 Tax=Paraburkholderia sp. HD33-4 TaxID=2883242 RepID=UPI001F2C7BD3|nr:hypothetical protein [Paraburkholderia sp. HD33-4]